MWALPCTSCNTKAKPAREQNAKYGFDKGVCRAMEIILVGIALFLVGLFLVLFPYQYWKFSESWKNKSGAEPTNRYIIGARIGGCFFMIIGLIALVVCT